MNSFTITINDQANPEYALRFPVTGRELRELFHIDGTYPNNLVEMYLSCAGNTSPKWAPKNK